MLRTKLSAAEERERAAEDELDTLRKENGCLKLELSCKEEVEKDNAAYERNLKKAEKSLEQHKRALKEYVGLKKELEAKLTTSVKSAAEASKQLALANEKMPVLADSNEELASRCKYLEKFEEFRKRKRGKLLKKIRSYHRFAAR